MSDSELPVAAKASGDSDIPRYIQLFRAFMKIEHLRGVSQDDIVAKVQAATLYIAREHVFEKLSVFNALAVPKVQSLINDAIVEEVKETLS